MEEIPEVVMIVVASTVLILFLGGIVIFILFTNQKRKFHHHQQLRELKNTYDHEILKTESEIREATMKNLSQELHDNIGTMVSLAIVNLGLHEMKSKDGVDMHISDAKQILDKAMNDLRDFAKSLNTSQVMEAGLIAAIEKEVSRLNKTNYYQVTFTVDNNALRLDPQRELILFRICQECISNIIKHSQAKKISIALVVTGPFLKMTITDYGIGFDNTKPKHEYFQTGGQGLENIRNRLKLINGNLHIHSAINKGTTVTVEVPNQNISI